MKLRLKFLIAFGVIAIASSCIALKAQVTNAVPNNMPPLDWFHQTLLDVEQSTNWVVAGGYGHSTTGIGRNVAFIEGGVNFNNYVGGVIGEDILWGNGKHQQNSIRGGLTLQAPMHLFAFTGVSWLTNMTTTPIAFDQIATSKSSTIANIVGGGMDFAIVPFWNLELHAGVDVENRTGDSTWGGTYWLGHFAITKDF